MSLPPLRPLPLGTLGTSLIAVGSFGAGATRNRGGVLHTLGLDFLGYGHGAGLSNAIVWAGILLLIAAWVLLGRQALCSPHRLHEVRLSLFAWVFPLFFAAPILSRDVYSYLMQGAMFRDGFDPYSQGAAVNPGPMLLEVSHDWRNTTTPYGPLHLWIGEGVTRLVGDNITAGILLYKLLSLLGFSAIAWAVPRLAQACCAPPAIALWMGVANPVMVLHLVGGMHNESIMVGLVSLGLVCAARHRYVSAIALIAVAVSLKATAALALPFVVWMALRRYTSATASLSRRVVAFLGIGGAGTALTLGVVAAITWASHSSWGWLAEISGNSKVINPLAAPSLLAGVATDFLLLFDPSLTFNVPLAFLRKASMVILGLGLVAAWWFFRSTAEQAVRGIAVAYCVAFVFNSVTLPWYYASLISLIAVTPIPRRILAWATGASIVVTLAFTGSGNHQLYNPLWMLAAALIAWGLSAWLFRTTTAPSPAPDASPRVPGGHAARR
ncbi:alpha-(1-_6)-mannopyranosyltransferase A [Corynebacterium sp. zg-331]|uniref:alpha-(1->6)-mannopyranosyltransferase A n=1 Tax=unclassified Corynebacterium TaxID=2624378 RepID=UPI00128E444F|nr:MULTISPECIES: alpha-(1->6)-mannopyranosyltransferase A [unclassified Corynebacterium]MBC3185209.1 alpha-(1->6)-mannopyranosyltransferase A [Corynebacterium sp. zg-331]MPV51707.1 alpha-(1->6)-mannopyranosyltransferase A [Corynebacterium sp. zg331]